MLTWLNWLCLVVSTKFMKWKPSAFWWEKDSKKPFTALPVRVRIHKPHHPMSQSPSHHPWAPPQSPTGLRSCNACIAQESTQQQWPGQLRQAIEPRGRWQCMEIVGYVCCCSPLCWFRSCEIAGALFVGTSSDKHCTTSFWVSGICGKRFADLIMFNLRELRICNLLSYVKFYGNLQPKYCRLWDALHFHNIWSKKLGNEHP